MLKCRDVTELTTDFMEGALPPLRWAAVQWHLLVCGHCRGFVDQMRRTTILLKRGHLPASAEAEAAIAARLAAARENAP